MTIVRTRIRSVRFKDGSANVRVLPGVFNPQLGFPVEIEKVLGGVADESASLRNLVVVGAGLDGRIRIWGTHPVIEHSIGLLMRGVSHLSRMTQVS